MLKRAPQTWIPVGRGLLLCLVFTFFSQAIPIHAQSVFIPSYGQGKISVRLYTDYFCVPCRNSEPKVEALLRDLVKRNVIKLTFADTPVHRQTPLYANYFLYILNKKNGFDHALFARAALFEAAASNIEEKDQLEEFLKKKGLNFKAFDTKPTFNALNKFIIEDRVKSTPSCVIDNGVQTQLYAGGDNIVRALELLR
jgi:thiol:disulfide interchange protein DsbA